MKASMTEKKCIVILANDASSFTLKEAVRKHLENLDYDVVDLGTENTDTPMSYVEAGERVAIAVRKADAKGILFCGSGAGVMLAANKHKGVYAVVCESVETARSARVINDANVLCMGANILEESLAMEMAEIFLMTGFVEDLTNRSEEKVRNFVCEVRKIEESEFK